MGNHKIPNDDELYYLNLLHKLNMSFLNWLLIVIFWHSEPHPKEKKKKEISNILQREWEWDYRKRKYKTKILKDNDIQ